MNWPIIIAIGLFLGLIFGFFLALCAMIRSAEKPRISWEVINGMDMVVTEHWKNGESRTMTWHCTDQFGIQWRDEQGRTELEVNGLYANYDCEELFKRKKFLIRKYGEALS